MAQPKIVGYLKPVCGWSQGVRAIFYKYGLEYEDRDIINDPASYEEMVRKSGQPLSPCVEIDGHMLADISGEEVESFLVQKGYVRPSDEQPLAPIDRACSEELHQQMAAGQTPVSFPSQAER